MPYCTIEEAWGNNQFNLDIQKQQQQTKQPTQEPEIPKIIVPENSYDFQDMYNNVQYPHVDYSDKLLSIYPVKEEPLKNPPREFDIYGRSNYQNLQQHNDNNKSLQGNQRHIKEYRNVQDNVEVQLHKTRNVLDLVQPTTTQQPQVSQQSSTTSTQQPQLSNLNSNSTTTMKPMTTIQTPTNTIDTTTTNSMESNKEYFTNRKLNYIEHLENENKKLKQLLETFQNKETNLSLQKNDMKSNMFDLLLYIISGIFIIFILDSFVKLIKNK